MRRYKKEEVDVIDIIVCNKCGREIVEEDVLAIEKRWGYFSSKDNEVHCFDLCEKCYDEWVSTFRIPIEIENR